MNNPDYKWQAAAEALTLIKPDKIIGLGAGACVANLVDLIMADENLKIKLTLTSSSLKTTNLMLEGGLNVRPPAYFNFLDFYFDGCDQFDRDLNALKSGGGIHTTEKLLASMAKEFVLLAESSKRVEQLDGTFPLLIELVPPSLRIVMKTLTKNFPAAVLKLRESKDGAVITEYGNYLLEVKFHSFPDLKSLNEKVNLIPGVVDHSLFYHIATMGITAGVEGIQKYRVGSMNV